MKGIAKYLVFILGAGACSPIIQGASSPSITFNLSEASITDLVEAMDSGVISSSEIVALYANRYLAYDRNGPQLNAIPVFDSTVFEQAAEADARRARGESAPLLGVPYTVKDSYKVRDLTVASGSPAFASLIANEDAFMVGRLRNAGAIMLGKTNMPPMAAGGMQPGVYGRAESPYNSHYLASARSSGSSNGAGVATTSNFASFGLGEETVSSGRAPTSYNSLVCYTPSRGILSIRGNWPLFADRDVVVPMTRTVSDLLEVLDVSMVSDPIRNGDFWLEQNIIKLPSPESIRPKNLTALTPTSLEGIRFAAPTSFIGKDEESDFFNYSLRPSIKKLWEDIVVELKAAGAEVVEVDLPLIPNYFEDRPNVETFVERGLLPITWWNTAEPAKQLDRTHLWTIYLEKFLQACEDPRYPSFTAIDATLVFPTPPGSIDEKIRGPYSEFWLTRQELISEGLPPAEELPDFVAYLEGLEKIRKIDFEDWLTANNFDAVIFPAVSDFGKADFNYNQESYDHATAPGIARGQSERMMRHLGIPSVTLPMGITEDVGMPVGLTIMGAAYNDIELLKLGLAIEAVAPLREAPPLILPLDDESFSYDPASVVRPTERPESTAPTITIDSKVTIHSNTVAAEYSLRGQVVDTSELRSIKVYVNGRKARVEQSGSNWIARLSGNEWSRSGASIEANIVVVAVDQHGNARSTMTTLH